MKEHYSTGHTANTTTHIAYACPQCGDAGRIVTLEDTPLLECSMCAWQGAGTDAHFHFVVITPGDVTSYVLDRTGDIHEVEANDFLNIVDKE